MLGLRTDNIHVVRSTAVGIRGLLLYRCDCYLLSGAATAPLICCRPSVYSTIGTHSIASIVGISQRALSLARQLIVSTTRCMNVICHTDSGLGSVTHYTIQLMILFAVCTECLTDIAAPTTPAR